MSKPYASPPIPVHDIAEQCGVNIVFTNFGKYGDEVAGFCDFAEEKLYVHSKDPMNRQLFTMAHELGHWLLHREHFAANPEEYNYLPRTQRVDRSSPLEQEANCFAANLLMPTVLLKPVKNVPAVMLASIFMVSTQAMQYRLRLMFK